MYRDHVLAGFPPEVSSDGRTLDRASLTAALRGHPSLSNARGYPVHGAELVGGQECHSPPSSRASRSGSVVNFFAHPTNLRLDRAVAEAESRRDSQTV